ncbi:hypothetical protein [Amycolatopsis sp. DG1A-15b]|uniref:hypothetical protein n=1 Tax=Amycolatopsis sp. DG1A-15b TaxID=3052846 RepID=UPI00255BA910|nr:hypothetical protein [Amycolatopsis sp. DG1A-15b]WIX92120.1 hypothetical protein QRY02_17405 [Amycolatopsis sp. DG1A-15b]
MPGLLGGEVQRPGDGVEDLVGGPHVAALLHALVVGRAHPGQQGQLLAAQSGDAPPRARLQTDVLRPHPGPQELGQRAAGVLGPQQGARPLQPVAPHGDQVALEAEEVLGGARRCGRRGPSASAGP